VEQVARAAFAALELADYGRIDVRLSADDGTPHVIDVNPNCDLTEGAGFSRAAAYGGYDYPALIDEVCRVALERNAHDAVAVPVVALDAHHPARASVGSARARGADRERRAVHAGGGGVRARAHRHRARQP
jgi:D-alanine-D-alanine ligase